MNKATAEVVRRRAVGRCEYCGVTEALFPFRFHVEHIIARQHGGSDTVDNLALACGFCNSHKGPNLSGIDPLTGTIVLLFHPRMQVWSEHFAWNGALIAGTTSHGRATVSVLAMNDFRQIAMRARFLDEGVLVPPAQ
jgi:hypothetical protein